MTEILITGSEGFIGKHLVKKLLENSDNNLTLLDKVKRQDLTNNPNTYFIHADLLKSKLPKDLTQHYDIIYHLAANSNANNSICRNFQMFQNLIIHLTPFIFNCKRFIFTSSAAIYGNSSYGNDKLKTNYFIKRNSIPSTVFVLYNVYGKNNNKGIIYNFQQALNKNKTFTINEDGNQTRDFVYIDDVIKIMIEFDQEGTFEIGTGISTSINLLIDKLTNNHRDLYKINYSPGNPEEIIHSKCKKPLKFNYTKLDEGLKNIQKKGNNINA